MSAPSRLETQPARTALAWQRTGLAVLAAAAGLGRLDWWRLGAGLVVPAIVVAISAIVAALPGHRSRGRGAASVTSGLRPTALVVAVLTLAVTECIAVSR